MKTFRENKEPESTETKREDPKGVDGRFDEEGTLQENLLEEKVSAGKGGSPEQKILLEKMDQEEEKQEKKEDMLSPMMTSWRFKTTMLVTLAVVHLVVHRLCLNMALVCMVKIPPPVATSPLRGSVPSINYNDTMAPSGGMEEGFGQFPGDIVSDNSTLGDIRTTEDVSAHACQGMVSEGTTQGDQKDSHEGEFEWSKLLQGHILSAFYYGLTAGQVVAGWLTDRWGGRRSLLVSVGVCSFLGNFLPYTARASVSWFFAIRTAQGLFSGVVMAAPAYMCARWGSSSDRNFLLGLVYTGFPIGIAANLVTSPFLCLSGPFGGWPSIFYFFSATGLLWCLAAYFCLFDTPAKNPYVSKEELRYLSQGQEGWNPEQQKNNSPGPIPWKNILTSVPILTTFWCGLCINFGYAVFSITQPFFMRDLFFFPIDQNGLMSLLPWVLDIPASLGIGMAVDFLKTKISLTSVRKIFNTLGCVIVGLVPLIVVTMDCSLRWVAATLLSLSEVGHCFSFVGGYLYTPVDLAPPYSAMIIGWGSICTGINGFVAPILVAYLTPTGSREEWRDMFLLSGFLYALTAIGFLVGGKAELEPWVIVKSQDPPLQEKELMLVKGDEEMGKTDVGGKEIPEETRLLKTREKNSIQELVGGPPPCPLDRMPSNQALQVKERHTPTAL
ncbi:putative transporter slc-17.2 [Oratosquilla oratoria]|uniref:putative transporter slc-17.2 n=1 Tax=Oratosquilla oratoria TaxID=337810 RepID=UPI003F770523